MPPIIAAFHGGVLRPCSLTRRDLRNIRAMKKKVSGVIRNVGGALVQESIDKPIAGHELCFVYPVTIMCAGPDVIGQLLFRPVIVVSNDIRWVVEFHSTNIKHAAKALLNQTELDESCPIVARLCKKPGKIELYRGYIAANK